MYDEVGVLTDMVNPDLNRRELLTGLTAVTLAGAAPLSAAGQEMPYRTLGSTGEKVSCIGIGGSHIGKPKMSDADGIKLIRSGLDRGINFLDNSWDYNNGTSETRMGKALQDGYRKKAFLMTKFDGRTKEEASKQIDESLSRLKTDHVDLLQFHETIRFDDPDRFFAKGGAIEALVAARKAGKTRYIGFTGHKDPHIHLYMLQLAQQHNFHFDTVQMPLNLMDYHYRSFAKLVVPEALKQKMGILAMKSMGSGVILKSKAVSAEECLTYALNTPASVVITGIDSPEILDQAFRVAGSFKPLSDQQLTALVNKTAQVAANGEYELFKTSTHFDSTIKHPEWLGQETEQVRQLGKEG